MATTKFDLAESQIVFSAVARAAMSNKQIPFVRYTEDGQRQVLGTAVAKIDNDDITMTVSFLAESHIGAALLDMQRRAIGAISVRPIDENDQDVCTDPSCTYMEPHKHGFACTKDCNCNRHGRVD